MIDTDALWVKSHRMFAVNGQAAIPPAQHTAQLKSKVAIWRRIVKNEELRVVNDVNYKVSGPPLDDLSC